MKLIVCVSCEAEFAIKHNMDDYHYRIMYCPFCGSDIDDPDFEDEIIDWEEDENPDEEYIYHNNSNPSESSDVKPLKVRC